MNHDFKIGDTVKLKTHDNLLFSVAYYPKPKNSSNMLDRIKDGVYDDDYIGLKRYEEKSENFTYVEVHFKEITLVE